MRILGVSEEWPKLKQDRWTTFRFKRHDRDWEVGEVAQVVLHPRSKGRKILGIATIRMKEIKRCPQEISDQEAREDGFQSWEDMLVWLLKAHGSVRVYKEPLNKLTMEWIK